MARVRRYFVAAVGDGMIRSHHSRHHFIGAVADIIIAWEPWPLVVRRWHGQVLSAYASHVGDMSRHATQLAILGKHAIFADILRYLMPDDTLATQIIVSCARL